MSTTANYVKEMFFHHIYASTVQPGDHLYRYRWRHLERVQGIAVQLNDSPSRIFVLIRNGSITFGLVTLEEFQGRGLLHRALYDQDNSDVHRFNFFGVSFRETKRPAEEIVQNALLLLDIANKNPDTIQQFLAHDLSDFARVCCTTSHEEWRNQLQRNGNSVTLVNSFAGDSHPTSTTRISEEEMGANVETP